MLDYESTYSSKYKLIAGIDEAGRGPLAGPVAIAICIMPLENKIEQINDSKKLTAKTREKLFDIIINTAIAYHIELIDEKTIDKINILEATKLGMMQCIKNIAVKPDLVLIDAVIISTDIDNMSIIKGDTLSYNIAAASILAKVTRDRLMNEYDIKYPEYGFSKHKGYGTALHLSNLRKFGRCAIHRNSFLKNFPEVK